MVDEEETELAKDDKEEDDSDASASDENEQQAGVEGVRCSSSV
jgi:hypothetical protein